MKILILGIILLMVLETVGQKVIEYPRIGSRTTETRTISRIELTDTATILYVEAKYRPHWWIKVESEECIRPAEGGKKLKLKSAEGIPIDKEFFMPDSGQHSFKLFFPSLPEGVTHMDWIFDEGEGLFDIALTSLPENRLFPEKLKGNWLKEDGTWEYSFEDSFAMADGDFWNYAGIKTRRGITEFHLKKGGREKVIFARIDKQGKVKIGKVKKQLVRYTQEKSERMPEDVGGGFEYPLLKMDTAVLKGYIKGYAPKMGCQQSTFYINNVLSGRQEAVLVKIEEDGRFEFKTEMNYPQPVLLRLPYRMSTSIFMGPGDTTLVCLDMAQFIDPWREMQDVEFREKTSLFAGAYALLNEELQQCGCFLKLDYRKIQRQVQEQTFEEFKRWILQERDQALQLLCEYKQRKGLSKAGEQVLTWLFELGCCNVLLDYDDMLETNWRKMNEKKKTEDIIPLQKPEMGVEFYDFIRDLNLGNEMPVIAGGVFGTTINRIKFSDPIRGEMKANIQELDLETELHKRGVEFTEQEREFFAVMKDFQKLENPDTTVVHQADKKYKEVAQGITIKYNRQLQEIVNEYMEQVQRENFKKYFNIKPGFLTEVIKLQDQLQLSDQTFEVLDKQKLAGVQQLFSHPFLKNYIAYCNERLKLKLETNQNKTGYTFHQVPEVKNEELFNAILELFKGKIVFVDFWATWCAPCRQGILKMKPIKEALADQEIAFVYITGETSPQKTYENMIPDIKGHHFRLSDAQWKYIRKQFQVDGIPHYMVVDKNGKIVEEKFNGWQEQLAIKVALLRYLDKKSE